MGKKVELVMRGGDIELDKGLIEELNDPLVHLLRNAVDHGVESPEERQAAGKPAQARLRLEAERRDQYLVITVADDGRGLDRERILHKAREKGLLAPGRTYGDQDVYALITEPGFSTAKEVTDISGRGVGLDVVDRAGSLMGAELIIASEPGRGSTFSIHMPLDRVVSDGITEAIIVMAGQEMFAIPSRQVTEVIAHDPAKVYTMQGERVVESRGIYYPLLDLAEVMECPGQRAGQAPILIIALVGRREVALLGDELIGHQQVVLRSLEKRAFPTVSAVSGCALIGDQIGLMLDLDGLAAFLKPASATLAAGAALGEQGAGVATKPARGWLMGVYIAFAVAAEKFAIAVEQIQEIHHYQKAMRAPHAPPHLLGLVNLRGRVIPVMDLRRRPGMGPSQPGSSEMIVIAPTLPRHNWVTSSPPERA